MKHPKLIRWSVLIIGAFAISTFDAAAGVHFPWTFVTGATWGAVSYCTYFSYEKVWT